VPFQITHWFVRGRVAPCGPSIHQIFECTRKEPLPGSEPLDGAPSLTKTQTTLFRVFSLTTTTTCFGGSGFVRAD
jgi:hypothetical protein